MLCSFNLALCPLYAFQFSLVFSVLFVLIVLLLHWFVVLDHHCHFITIQTKGACEFMFTHKFQPIRNTKRNKKG